MADLVSSVISELEIKELFNIEEICIRSKYPFLYQ